MKKYLCLILAITMILSACSISNDTDSIIDITNPVLDVTNLILDTSEVYESSKTDEPFIFDIIKVEESSKTDESFIFDTIKTEESSKAEIATIIPLANVAEAKRPDPPPPSGNFDSFEDWIKFAVQHPKQPNFIVQKKMYIIPILPEDYGTPKIRWNFSRVAMFYYEDASAQKIKELQTKHGEDEYIYIAIPHHESGILKKNTKVIDALKEEIDEERKSFEKGPHSTEGGTFASGFSKSNGRQFAYTHWTGRSMSGKPFSRAYIYTFHENKYRIVINLSVSNEQEILDFIDIIQFETIKIPDDLFPVIMPQTTTITTLPSPPQIPIKLGHILGNPNISIFDALELLKYITGMESVIDTCENARAAALIVSSDVPGIFDVLEILKALAGMESAVSG